MKHRRINNKSASGFTLIEILITMAIFGIIVTAMYGVFDNSNRNYAVQNEVVDAQNNLRAAVGLLTRELRMADEITSEVAAPNAVGNAMAFTTEDGTIEYYLHEDGTLKRKLTGGNFETIAENISELEFDYSEKDDGKITFTITAETTRWDRERTATVTVQARNM